MAVRQTRKTGIPRVRTEATNLQRTLEAIIERLEVLDGIRGDNLDKAVTFRDLGDAGVTVGTGGTGGAIINRFPASPSDEGPAIGPAAAPTNLSVAETFLALLITWDNPSFNLQHIEVWRSATDNLSTATMVGTTVSPQFIDYVGASQTYYYWVRAVGTDGTYSAYNAVAGTVGTTGTDPGNLTIDPRFFTLADGTGTELPFLTDGAGSIGIDGDLIVDGTIRAQSLIAGTIGAEYLAVTQLDAIAADLGTITAGLFRTAASPAYRVEVEDQASTAYPFWYGSGAKSAPNGRFYFDQNGNVYVKGLLDAGMIAQTFFAPATTEYNSFRIACQYPTNYSGGVYTGLSAHLNPVRSTSQATPVLLMTEGLFPDTQDTYTSPTVSFYGPEYSGVSLSYGRLGTSSELLLLNLIVTATSRGTVLSGPQAVDGAAEVDLQYQYSGDTQWSYLTTLELNSFGSGTTGISIVVSTRTTTFDSIAFRYRVRPLSVGLPVAGDEFDTDGKGYFRLTASSLTVSTSNLGYADSTLTLLTLAETDDTPLTPEQLEAKPGVPQLPGNDGDIIP